jgi:ethanolamine transporter EutH
MKNSHTISGETSDLHSNRKGPKSMKKGVITGIVTAAVACSVCLVPTALAVVVGGGALSLLNTWLGFSAVTVLTLGAVGAFGLWFYKARSRKCSCSVGAKEPL